MKKIVYNLSIISSNWWFAKMTSVSLIYINFVFGLNRTEIIGKIMNWQSFYIHRENEDGKSYSVQIKTKYEVEILGVLRGELETLWNWLEDIKTFNIFTKSIWRI